MLKRVFFNHFLIAFLLFSLASCSKFRRIEKSEDWRVKYDAALNYYENKDYYRAGALFEQILPIVRGLPEGEKVQFYFAYTQYNQDFFLLAAHHFKVFYQTYARSEFAQEAQYMHAYSLYANSPAYNLDQTSSIEAVIAMQAFVNRYPTSAFRDKATAVIDDIQEKLERKGYENARQYYKMERYKAAVVAFETFKNDFPDSEFNEEIAFLKFMAQYELAKKSITSRQLERYREANEFYLEFIDTYPNSKYAREAEKKYNDSLEKATELAKK
ncbi:Outer membrane assembly lipoprotein YfiO [Fulvivirga imtechensis AK7]|uniref:Outer membrane assembly lipoprotein YfiO n=1 Tax=Fulvivirga imtechensis AK7 TaxID=1237149 RepID=L8JS80_9BACT|nr:outer membrane protein assembly factor BamD [Fulvivirga imtechensis]ELR70339.1 Outer membrane assembly lipoprotein YfiO [Fulvivirga imtechensis AK7]